MSIDALARRWWRGDLGATGTALNIALAPAEAAYRIGTHARNRAYDRRLLSSHTAGLPVISVGNIAVGGTGKTPFTNWLARRLRARGERPTIVHGGYAADEPELHRTWAPDIPVIVDRDRVRAARTAHDARATVLVLDDAFQHRRLRRDLDIVLVSVERWSDAMRLLPRGPWRESPAALKRAHLIVCVRRTPVSDASMALAARLHTTTGRPALRVYLRATAWQQNGTTADAPPRPGVTVSGLADPDLFVDNVRAAGARVTTALTFPDHHEYDDGDIARIRSTAGAQPVITSAKDWVKLRGRLDESQVWVLTQELVIEEGESLLDSALDRVLR